MKKQTKPFLKRLKLAFISLFETPWKASLTAGLIFITVSLGTGKIFQQSDYPYFNYLADAFLHGQTWLRQVPPSIKDLSFFNGRYYLYWGPFPAILLIPFVAVFGIQFNDVLFTIMIGMFNVGLVAYLLRVTCRTGFLRLSETQRAILSFFFAFGTVHFTLPPYGKVWMTASLIGFTCTLFAYLAVFTLKGRKAWFYMGLALSGAMLTRSNLIFTGIFPLIYLLYRQKPLDKRIIINIFVGGLPLVIALGSFLFYNQIRFGNPFDIGVNYNIMHNFYKADFEWYGVFNIHYVPVNLYYQYIFYPFPIRQESLMGGSLFLLSPLFFSSFFAIWKTRNKLYIEGLFASILITNIPIILIIGTGWTQFGPRYTLDFTVPLLLLCGLGIEKWNSKTSFILALISVFHYLIGVTLCM